MKTTERHRLKENEVVYMVERALGLLGPNRQRALTILAVAILVGGAVGGYFVWRAQTNGKAEALLGEAMAVMEMPVSTAPAPVPGQPATPPPPPAPGSYASERAKLEAALPKFLAAAEGYPKTNAGLSARYQAAGVLTRLDQPAEAAKRFREVMDLAGPKSIYDEMARLGKASAEAQSARFEDAIKTYADLSNNKDGDLPPDAMLMQLGRTYLLAGKAQEARAAFRRLLDEYPSSQFAGEAKREVDQLNQTS